MAESWRRWQHLRYNMKSYILKSEDEMKGKRNRSNIANVKLMQNMLMALEGNISMLSYQKYEEKCKQIEGWHVCVYEMA